MGMQYRLKKTIALIGMMGAGKTAVGKVLASNLAVKFVDSDAEIEAASNMAIPEIFQRDGEAFFRGKESQVLKRLLAAEPFVLSTGGGTFLQLQNRRVLAKKAISIFLQVDLDLLWSRVRKNTGRPLLKTADPYATLRELQRQRDSTYQLADVTISAEASLSIEQMATRVLASLIEQTNIVKEIK